MKELKQKMTTSEQRPCSFCGKPLPTDAAKQRRMHQECIQQKKREYNRQSYNESKHPRKNKPRELKVTSKQNRVCRMCGEVAILPTSNRNRTLCDNCRKARHRQKALDRYHRQAEIISQRRSQRYQENKKHILALRAARRAQKKLEQG